MSIKKFLFRGLAVFSIFALGSQFPVAATVELEEADEMVPAAPAKENSPKPEKAKPEAAPPVENVNSSPEKPIAPAAPRAQTAASQPRVRISDKVGFYYFLKSGFLVSDESKIDAVGKVLGSFNEQEYYSVPNRVYVDLSKSQKSVKPKDLLVVYQVAESFEEPHSGFSGYWVKNTAVIKVLSVENQKCLAEVKESFYPFSDGDKVKSFEDELSRWKEAQVKKTLPDQPIKCYVAGSESGIDNFSQSQFIVLTAGKQQGVVEGQTFQISETQDVGTFEPNLQSPQGLARVFYAGSNYCMAQILFDHKFVKKGNLAVYQP
jgi:hypothetical protein